MRRCLHDRMSVLGIALGIAVLCGLPSAWAEVPAASQAMTTSSEHQACCRTSARAPKTCPLEGPFGKLGRGVSNLVAGWLELPETVRRRYAPEDAAASIGTGIAFGLLRSVARTGVGLYETVTFPIPLPKHYHPILPPLESFQRGEGSRVPFWAD